MLMIGNDFEVTLLQGKYDGDAGWSNYLTKEKSVKKGQRTETHVWHYWLFDDQNIWEANKWSSAHIVLAPWIWQLERSAEWQMTRDLIGNKSQIFLFKNWDWSDPWINPSIMYKN